MATFHISRDEAAKDFDDLIARASRGDEVVIEENSSAVAVLRAPMKPRLLSETIRILQERESKVTLDGDFEKDVMEFIDSHREPMRNLWD